MLNSLNKIIWVFVVGLIIGNIYVFLSGMQLADEINYFERQTAKIHTENLELEKKLSSFDSYTYAATMAAEMKFTKNLTPMYLDDMKYALNR